jgi:hypothetical protein
VPETIALFNDPDNLNSEGDVPETKTLLNDQMTLIAEAVILACLKHRLRSVALCGLSTGIYGFFHLGLLGLLGLLELLKLLVGS